MEILLEPYPQCIGWCSSCDRLVYEDDVSTGVLIAFSNGERIECPTCGDWLIDTEEDAEQDAPATGQGE